MSPISVNLAGFNQEECLQIQSKSLYDASYQYGVATHKLVKNKLKEFFEDLNDEEKKRRISWALNSCERMIEVAKSGLCTINHTNYLSRYLETLAGFCKGAEISIGEGALLQMELEVGCQTLITQDKQQGNIRFVHTEEDGDYQIPELHPYPYRWVEMRLPDKTINSFIYPGMCSWGPAFGINQTTGLTQLVDDLFIKNEFYGGIIWCNAVAFMALDLGSIDLIGELFQKIATYPYTKYAGGYALNLIESKPIPRMAVVEFVHDHHYWLPLNESSDAYWLSHTNYVLSTELQSHSTTSYPLSPHSWSVVAAQDHLEMFTKQQHLDNFASTVNWYLDNKDQSINKGLSLLADPSADIKEFHESGKVEYRLCCLPSVWTAAHVAGFVSHDESCLHVGKLTPPPLPDQPYSLTYSPDYPYLHENLWQRASLLYEQYLHSDRKDPNAFE